EKNQELKQVMLEETPWVVQAQNETERKRRVGLLFDLNRMSSEQKRAFDKLSKMQASDGGFPWFNGSPSSRYITQYLVSGFGHLQMLDNQVVIYSDAAEEIVERALDYLDNRLWEDYDQLLRNNTDTTKQTISALQLHYLYACSFTKHKPSESKHRKAFDFYLAQASKYWKNATTYGKALTALTLHRFGQHDKALEIIKILKSKAMQSEELGMYWKDNVAGYFWHEAPIETQAAVIEAFNEVASDAKSVEEMKIWLLRNKQTNDWRTTKATSEAIYALLMTGSSLLDETKALKIEPISGATPQNNMPALQAEPGTGYVKTAVYGADVNPSKGNFKVYNPNNHGIAWGGMYWQYFEQLDKITQAETSLKMNKQLYIRTLTEHGEQLQPITDGKPLKVGDLVCVRIELRADRDYEYVHLKDMRASCFEPVSTLSRYRWQDGLGYYESVKDASSNFFITSLPKGVYVFEYDLRVTHVGTFSNGITTFQCMYAPEFSSHSEGVIVVVKPL
ncbi:MAG: hypothetical protein LBD53_07760, partial [Tannerella sp.]|nr:hypothetical protein [Tannerella sp.]